MAKNYVLLNFTDYRVGSSDPSARTTPVSQLTSGFSTRATNHQGTFSVHHMADLFGGLRSTPRMKKNPVEGVLSEGLVKTLCVRAAVWRSQEWSEMLGSVRSAHRIIFAAHGYANDVNWIYTDDGNGFIWLGDVAGVVHFLSLILSHAQNHPSITLVVCYAARSTSYQRRHVNAHLNEAEIQSSLAYKIFKGVSDKRRPLKLTARTGGMSVRWGGTALLSETEEAIFAQDELNTINPTEERAQRDELEGLVQLFEKAVKSANLSETERSTAGNFLIRWIKYGHDPKELQDFVKQIGEEVWAKELYGASLMWKFGVKQTWPEANQDLIGRLEAAIAGVHRIDQLRATAAMSEPHYGKFIYECDGQGAITVSQRLGNQTWQVL